MSLTLKIASLTIRTLAKPIANYIKRNAREHEKFRSRCISLAQNLHRVDMRMRLGLLQDPAAIERQIQKELAEAEARRQKAAIPTVKTEAQMKAEEKNAAKVREKIEGQVKSSHKPRIRPLSEAKAIETGANFISETFLYVVAVGLIGFETWRSRRKENNRREGVADQLELLESKNDELEAKVRQLEQMLPALPSPDRVSPEVPKPAQNPSSTGAEAVVPKKSDTVIATDNKTNSPAPTSPAKRGEGQRVDPIFVRTTKPPTSQNKPHS